MKFLNIKKIISTTTIIAIFFVTGGAQIAQAAALTALSDTMSSNKINAASSHVIKFTTPTGAEQSSDTITITFPSDFDFTSKTIGTLTLTHGATTGLENTETLAASPSTSAWGAVFSGTENRILTLTAPSDGTGAAAMVAGNKVILTYNSTNSVNPSSATSYVVSIAGDFGDTGSITVPILTDDQVQVSATVSQSITFTISDNSIGFGNLTSANARYATGDASGSDSETGAHDIVVGTNASGGYTLTMTGATLTSGGNTIDDIGASNAASSAGTEQFGVRFTASGGSGTVAVPYAASGFAFDDAAFPDTVASAGGATANTTYSARYLANITSNTEAGSYTATMTYVAVPNY